MTWRPGNSGKEEENLFDSGNDEKMKPLGEREAPPCWGWAEPSICPGRASLAPLTPPEMNNPIELEPCNKSGKQKQHRHDDEPFSAAALINPAAVLLPVGGQKAQRGRDG